MTLKQRTNIPKNPKQVKLSLRKIFTRPEFTAVTGTVIVFLWFAINTGSAGFLTTAMTRNYFEVAASIGIIAVPITLLVVAGEFDMSVGSMVAAGQVTIAYFIVYAGWSPAAAFGMSVVIACLMGAVNGFLVVRTKLPSLIITLAMLYIIRGVTQGSIRMLTGLTTIDRVRNSAGDDLFSRLFSADVGFFSISLVWWIALTIIAWWVLENTRFGNWIYATGGNAPAAVRSGVPVSLVKIVLYMATAASTSIVAMSEIFAINQGNANAAVGREFEVVVATVIGGALITGGYGSPIGAFFGALLFGMVNQGFFFTTIPDQWFQTFLGVMLLIAVVINTYVRNRALRPEKRPK
jgi:simple sugar transport system permease protein